MQYTFQLLRGKFVCNLTTLLVLIIFSSCSSDCRKLDAVFGQIAGREAVSVGDWEWLTGELQNNRSIYEDCDRGLYNNGKPDREAILGRIISSAAKNHRNPAFSRELTLALINETVSDIIPGGAGLQEIQNRFERFILNYQNLFSVYFPELYSGNAVSSELFTGIYDSHIISPRLYMERSGSMVFYDAGNRNLVTAMRQIINRFPQYSMDKKLVYVVADRIAHWDIAYSDFLQTANIYGATSGLVNPSWTDFPAIFRDILNNTRDNQISILFSDLVYDVKTATPGISPEGFANQAQEMTHAVFNTHAADFGVIILKMNGDYEGIYYPPLSNHFPYRGTRPYYICLIGKTSALHKMMTQEPYRAVKEFSTLPGYESSHAIYRMNQSPWHSIIVPHTKNSRYVQPARSALQKGRIDRLENAKIHDRESSFRFVVAADLSALWFDDSFKTDHRNYRIKSRDDFYIEEIIPIRPGDISSASQRYARSATHLIVLQTDRLDNPRQEITIEIINEFPQWIRESSTFDDSAGNIPGFASTTFGLEQLTRGIYNAFYQAEGNSIISFKIELN
jgi:hypothetical protein